MNTRTADEFCRLRQDALHAMSVRVPRQDLLAAGAGDAFAHVLVSEVVRDLVDQFVNIRVSGQMTAVLKELMLTVLA